MKQIPGIYAIVNKTNNRVYIGRSNNVSSRVSNHKHYLRKSEHNCSELQTDWNNGDEITFEVVEYCPSYKIAEREQYWLNKLNGEGANLYNKNKVQTISSTEELVNRLVHELSHERSVNIFIING